MDKKIVATIGAAIAALAAIPALILGGLVVMLFIGETEEEEGGGSGFSQFCIPQGILEEALEGGLELVDIIGGTYHLGPVKPHTKAVAEHLGAAFGIKTIGGYRADAIDKAGHPAGLSLDLMTSDIPNGDAVGNQMAAYIIANAEALSVDYLIWHQKFWNTRTRTWTPMEDRGSISANHYDHIHLNVTPTPQAGFGIDGVEMPTCDESPGAITADGWTHPLPAATRLTSRFGEVRSGYIHAGDDLPAPEGTPIYAAADGTVIDAHCQYRYGRSPCQIRIDHGGGIQTLYVHMYPTGVHVTIGQIVEAGTHIAGVGSNGRSTGNHLHLEVWKNGTPINPYRFFADRGITLDQP